MDNSIRILKQHFFAFGHDLVVALEHKDGACRGVEGRVAYLVNLAVDPQAGPVEQVSVSAMTWPLTAAAAKVPPWGSATPTARSRMAITSMRIKGPPNCINVTSSPLLCGNIPTQLYSID